MKLLDVKSVADQLLCTALTTPDGRQKTLLMPGARDLAKCKRMSYDMTALEAVTRSRETVTTPEILSQFQICKLPFDNVWLEGPTPWAVDRMEHDGSREGYVLKTLPEEGFSVQRYSSILMSSEKRKMLIQGGYARAPKDGEFNPISYISYNESFKATINSKRIDLDDEKLLKFLEKREIELQSEYDVNGRTPLDFLGIEETIDILFNATDFIARMIVMMNSKPLDFGVENSKDRQELESDRKIQFSLTLKIPRTVDVRPIKIDLAKVTTANLETLRSDEPRDNQGITSVCGHMCYPKNREPYWMPPHDRAKLLPGDNRNAERQLKSTKEQLAMAIQGGVPTRIIKRAEDSLEKLSS